MTIIIKKCTPFLIILTVRIITSAKRVIPQDRSTKTYTKRVHYNENQSTLTHIGAPVNPVTAKALAIKLNERHNQMNRSEIRSDGPFKSDVETYDQALAVAVKIEPQSNGSNCSNGSNGAYENNKEDLSLQKLNAVESVSDKIALKMSLLIIGRLFDLGENVSLRNMSKDIQQGKLKSIAKKHSF